MRLYITYSQLQIASQFLLNCDLPCMVVQDAFLMGTLSCGKDSWGCVLCSVTGPKDVGWLLEAWNKTGGSLVEIATVGTGNMKFLVACPDWARNDPFVKTLIRKLSGSVPEAGGIAWEKRDGVVPAIAQDAETGLILMQAWMDETAYEETIRTRRAVYFSTSRRKLWRKGEESGNEQEVIDIRWDCDLDAVVLQVRQIGGAACHEGYASCFYRSVNALGGFTVIGERLFDPKEVYKK